MSIINLRDQILNAQDIPHETVTVGEWGDAVIEVRGMTAAERTRLMELAQGDDDKLNVKTIYPQIVIATCFDPETDAQIFTDADEALLLQKAATALDKVAEVGMRLSGFTEKAVDKAGKDSSSTPAEGSSLS